MRLIWDAAEHSKLDDATAERCTCGAERVTICASGQFVLILIGVIIGAVLGAVVITLVVYN